MQKIGIEFRNDFFVTQDFFFGAKWPTSYALVSCTMENTATLRLHREDT